MADFLTDALAIVLPELSKRGIPASAAPGFVAQLAVETGYGSSKNYQARNNWAGIRGAAVTSGNDRGYQTYQTKADGAAAYFALLDRKYSSVLAAGKTGDPYKVAQAFGASPWAATRYRLNADGTDDKAGDAGKILGTVGTEGQALYPAIKKAQAAQTKSGGGGGSWDAPKDVPADKGIIDKAKDAAGGAVGAVGGAIGGAVGGAASGALGTLIDWGPARKTIIAGVLVAGAAALIVAGALVATKPARDNVTETVITAAPALI